MPSTREKEDRRHVICLEIVEIMEKHGRNYDWPAFAREKGVPRATMYRWVREIHESGVAAQRRLRKERTKAKRQASDAAKLYGEPQAEMKRLEQLADELPAIPTGRDALGLDMAELGRRLEDCAERADRLLAFSEREDGAIRAPKLYAQAVQLKLRIAETMPRVIQFLWSVRQAERTIRIMFDEIGNAEPAVAHRILEALHAKNREMGIFL